MSHFCTLVIGDDIETQLAPYHEFECTDIDVTDQYKKLFEKCSERGQTFRDFVESDGKPIIGKGETPSISGKHKYGYAIEDGETITVIDRTNPNKKWDWWVIGGRYSGRLITRDGATADQARLSDINFDAMAERRRDACLAQWKEFEEAPDSKKGITALLNDIRAGDTKESYLGRHASGFVTFAVVKDGKWYERGKMGWWAVVSEEKNAEQWEAEFKNLLASLPADTLLTIVDCHI